MRNNCVLYLADGPWGVDYAPQLVQVTNFDIAQNDNAEEEGVHFVERNMMVSGNIKGIANMFRHLLPGDQELDVTPYNVLSFSMVGSHPVEVILLTDAIEDWNNRLRTTITPSEDEKNFTIPFEDFVDGNGNAFDLESVKSLVFSVAGNYKSMNPFSIEIKDVQLREARIAAVNSQNSKTNQVINYPNPFTGSTTIQLPNVTGNVVIKVYDTNGRLLDQQSLTSDYSDAVRYTAKSNLRGRFYYSIKDAAQKEFKGSFVIIK